MEAAAEKLRNNNPVISGEKRGEERGGGEEERGEERRGGRRGEGEEGKEELLSLRGSRCGEIEEQQSGHLR